MKSNKMIIYWLLTGCALVFLMVVIGCLTRLTRSGLSITDWSVMGTLPPLSLDDWNEHFTRYQQSPEFNLVNSAMTLDAFKGIFWWEWIHRFVGRITGGVFLAGFLYFLAVGRFTRKLFVRSLVLLCIGASQGLVGWWMVKSGLVKDPHVSHFRLAIHLMMAFAAFAASFWFALELIYEKSPGSKNDTGGLFVLTFVAFAATIIQTVYGAFVAGLKAGYYYPTWPKMGDAWFPSDAILTSGSMLIDLTENPVGVQFVHRTFAWVVAALIVLLWVSSRRLTLNRVQTKAIRHLVALLVVQILLGIAVILSGVHIVSGVLHQAVAFALFANFIFLLFHLQKRAV